MTTSFSDALTTIDPNNSNGLGANWMQGTRPSSTDDTNINGAAAMVRAATKDGTNAMCWDGYPSSSNLATFGLFRAFAFPIPLYVDVRGLSQFCQCTNVKLSLGADGSKLSSGPMVQFAASNRRLNAYALVITPDRSWFVIRFNDSVATVLSSAAAGADGDIWKINADTSNSAQVVVQAFRNGSMIANVTDSSISRLSHGIPAMYCQFDTNLSTTATAEWRTFSAGTGL